MNDVRVIIPYELNGYGLDAQWNDDFHHAIISLVTGERKSYYGDFGSIDHLEKAYNDGFVYSWDYSENRKRHHGTSSDNIPGKQFIVCLQNHDQVGNRLLGERVSHLIPDSALKLIAGALFIAPYIPLVFMGEEFAADTPFMYFISHGDEKLVQAVREGRAREFADMHGNQQAPDPQTKDVFNKCKIDWDSVQKPEHRIILEFYKKMISMRKDNSLLSKLSRKSLHANAIRDKNVLIVERENSEKKLIAIMNFNNSIVTLESGVINFSGKKIIDSSEEIWNGKGTKMPSMVYQSTEYQLSPYQFILYESSTI